MKRNIAPVNLVCSQHGYTLLLPQSMLGAAFSVVAIEHWFPLWFVSSVVDTLSFSLLLSLTHKHTLANFPALPDASSHSVIALLEEEEEEFNRVT